MQYRRLTSRIRTDRFRIVTGRWHESSTERQGTRLSCFRESTPSLAGPLVPRRWKRHAREKTLTAMATITSARPGDGRTPHTEPREPRHQPWCVAQARSRTSRSHARRDCERDQDSSSTSRGARMRQRDRHSGRILPTRRNTRVCASRWSRSRCLGPARVRIEAGRNTARNTESPGVRPAHVPADCARRRDSGGSSVWACDLRAHPSARTWCRDTQRH